MNKLHGIGMHDNFNGFEGLLVINYKVQCKGLGFSGYNLQTTM